jgi:Na+:H+ antiporter
MAVLLTPVVVLLGRGLTVYPLSLRFQHSRWADSLREQHVLWWGGLRGALALALVLSVPPTLPLRHEIVVVTFGVVAFSIVVQGLTMPLLLRRLGFLPKLPPAKEKHRPGVN